MSQPRSASATRLRAAFSPPSMNFAYIRRRTDTLWPAHSATLVTSTSAFSQVDTAGDRQTEQGVLAES